MAVLNITSLYDDLSYTSTQYANLHSVFSGYEYYTDVDYVALRSGQYEYYLVAGDITYDGTSLVGKPLDGQSNMFVAKYNARGLQDRTQYEVVDNITSFRVSDVNYMTVSNISGLGFYDSTSESYGRSVLNSELSIVCTVFLLVITFRHFWGGVNKH